MQKGKSRGTRESQRQVCARFTAPPQFVAGNAILGASAGVFSGEFPLNGQRHVPGAGESGWYLWTGLDLPKDSDYFKPYHVSHVVKAAPAIGQYLGLPPGWRFLLAPGYEDVWFDESLLADHPE